MKKTHIVLLIAIIQTFTVGAKASALSPLPPTNITASQGTKNGYVTVSWSASPDAASINSYRLFADGMASYCNGVSVTRSSISCGTSDTAMHSYIVKAVSSAGAWGVASNPVNGFSGGLVVVAPPTNLAATQGTQSGQVTITWTRSIHDEFISSYWIFVDGKPGSCGGIGSGHPSAYCYAADNALHSYTVRSKVITGGTWSANSVVVTGFAYSPGSPAPTALAASQGTVNSGVALTWNPLVNTIGLQSYQLLRDDGNWQDVGLVTRFTDRLNGTDNHSYKIRGKYAGGPSLTSAAVTGFSAGGKEVTTYIYRVKIN